MGPEDNPADDHEPTQEEWDDYEAEVTDQGRIALGRRLQPRAGSDMRDTGKISS